MYSIYSYWYWNNFYSIEEINTLHNLFHQYENKQFVDEPAENSTKMVNLKSAFWKHFRDKLWTIEQSFLKVNQEYFGYNIWPQFDGNSLLLNEYDSKQKGEYDWHTDGSKNHNFDVKFTMLINASKEPYEGGKFYLWNNSGPEHVKELDNPGNVIVFKSYMPHKVEPVTKGKRHSITLFYGGPRFI